MSKEMKRYKLKLKNKYVVGEDYYVFDFNIPENIEFKEGQYGVFMHVDKEIEGRKIRVFSIASSINEEIFKISLKITIDPSDFKAKMRDLEIGDSMTFDGPMGTFILEEEYDSVFIAGGIGITPIRGLLHQLDELKSPRKSELIYSEPREIYPFKDEFDNMDFVEKHYKNTKENTKEIIDKVSKKHLDNTFYYVSGSPGFVTSVKEQLIENEVNSSNIKFDRFTGY